MLNPFFRKVAHLSVAAYQRRKLSADLKLNRNVLYQVLRDGVERRLEGLKNKFYIPVARLSAEAYVTSEPTRFADRESGRHIAAPEGTRWAERTFDCCWLHVTGTLPTDKSGLVFLIDCGGEGLVYDKLGNIKQGITCRASTFSPDLGDPTKRVVFNEGLSSGNTVDFWIDCAANDLFGSNRSGATIRQLRIAKPQPNVHALYYDLLALLGVVDCNPADERVTAIYRTVRSILSHSASMTEERAAEYRQTVASYLAEHNEEDTFEYTGIGHAHLDLACKWPLRESYRKGARTFATQLMNMERYPEYVFGASQAQLFDWMRTKYPDLYKKIKQYHRMGRLELQGATWVEMDSNLTSGESLIRQFYYGKKYFLKEFREDMCILWLPDSFGYSACLPQVMRLSEVPYFMTQKLSWNTVNKFPYYSFNWVGLDGSTVLAHMLPQETYNAPVVGTMLKRGELNYAERPVSNRSLALFGIGDGGAGPGFEHIEGAIRLKDLKGLPRYKMDKAINFFDELATKAKDFPTFKGELYLERHQGTYTTQSNNKKCNRRCEYLLTDYEILYAIAKENNVAQPISLEELEAIWKEVLLYQFHDILPGSSINRVYIETRTRYDIILEKLREAIGFLAQQLFRGRGMVNLTSFRYQRPVQYKGVWYAVDVPALGFAQLKEETIITTFHAQCHDLGIENDCVSVRFSDGVIVSLYDKVLQKEFVPQGKALNVFSMYEDKGDCWDIRPVDYYKRRSHTAKCTAFRTHAEGAKATAEVTLKVDKDEIRQTIYIVDGSPLVTFETTVQHVPDNNMLRVAFPLDIATADCSYNVQFGHIERPMTEKNTIDTAQFETCGQKFVDMSDGNIGLSIINDCKYGYRAKHGVIDMDLIRSPKGGPGKNVDNGEVTFTYALFPHHDDLGKATYREAYFLNNRPIMINGLGYFQSAEFFRTDNENIILEGIKVADNGEDVILHVYNSSAIHQRAKIEYCNAFPTHETNILEYNTDVSAGAVNFGPFELKLLRVIL